MADHIMLLHPLMKVPTHTKSKEKCVCKLSLVFVLSFCFYLKILWLLKLLRSSLRIANHIMLIHPLIKVPTHTKAWREKMNAEGLNLYTSFVFDLFPLLQAPLFLQSKPHLLHHHHQYLRTGMHVYFTLLFKILLHCLKYLFFFFYVYCVCVYRVRSFAYNDSF